MRNIELLPEQIEQQCVCLGFEGEQNHTRVLFRCGKIFAEHPSASASVTVRSPHGTLYRFEPLRTADDLSWILSVGETAYAGVGQYQLTFSEGIEIVKTFVGSYIILESLMANGHPPDPMEDWLERADETLDSFIRMTASAEMLETGAPATAEMRDLDGHKDLRIGVPKGDRGPAGVFDFDFDENGHLIMTYADAESIDFEMTDGRLILIWQRT